MTSYSVDISPNHVGAIGETVFTAHHEPPAPVVDVVFEHAREHCPLEVTRENTHISVRDAETHSIYTAEADTNRVKWVPDATIDARVYAADDGWTSRFPVEIKTGQRATLERTQREAMEYISELTEHSPMYVRLRIDDLPESYEITTIELL